MLKFICYELQADSPQSSSLQQQGRHPIVNAAQFADSMVPDTPAGFPQDPSSTPTQHRQRPKSLTCPEAHHDIQTQHAQRVGSSRASHEKATVAWPSPPRASARGPAGAGHMSADHMILNHMSVATPHVASDVEMDGQEEEEALHAPGSQAEASQPSEVTQSLTAQASSFANRALEAVTHMGRSDKASNIYTCCCI